MLPDCTLTETLTFFFLDVDLFLPSDLKHYQFMGLEPAGLQTWTGTIPLLFWVSSFNFESQTFIYIHFSFFFFLEGR